MDLGFGGPAINSLARIPARFFTKSHVSLFHENNSKVNFLKRCMRRLRIVSVQKKIHLHDWAKLRQSSCTISTYLKRSYDPRELDKCTMS